VLACHPRCPISVLLSISYVDQCQCLYEFLVPIKACKESDLCLTSVVRTLTQEINEQNGEAVE